MYRSYRILVITLACIPLVTIVGCRRPTSPKSLKAKRERAQENGSQKPQRRLREMNEAELLKAATYYEKVGPQEVLISAYQRIVNVSQNPEYISLYLKKLGDVYLKSANYKEAKVYYHKFIATYPGHDLIIEVRYKEIVAHFMSSLSPQKDQAATHQVIKLGKHFLADYAHDEDAHQAEVVAMLISAYKRLIAYELHIVRFYLNKFSIDQLETSLHAALYRVAHILKTYFTDLALLAPEYQQHIIPLALPSDVDIEEQIADNSQSTILQLIKDRMQTIEKILADNTQSTYSPAYFRDKF